MKALVLTFTGDGPQKNIKLDECYLDSVKFTNEYVSANGLDMGMLKIDLECFNFNQLFEKDTWIEMPIWAVTETGDLQFCILYEDDRYDRKEAEDRLFEEASTFGQRFKDAIISYKK